MGTDMKLSAFAKSFVAMALKPLIVGGEELVHASGLRAVSKLSSIEFCHTGTAGGRIYADV